VDKLKILLVCEQSLPSKKRAGRPNYSVKYLSELGNDITVICPKSDLPEDNLANYEYINLEFKQFNIFSRIKIMREMKKRIKELCKQEKFDIIRTISILPTYAAISNKNEIKIPIYADINDFISDLYIQFDMPFKSLIVPFLKRMEKKIAKTVNYANVETDKCREFWSEYGLNKERIVVIPTGVDIEHFNPAKANPNILRKNLELKDEVIFYHGDISPYDGIHLLIKAVGKLKKKPSLLIVGDGKPAYISYLKALARETRSEKEVRLTGWIKYEELPNYIALATVCAMPILPMTKHNQANLHAKVKEYLSMCKPFIVTKTEGYLRSLGNIPMYFRNSSNVDMIAEDLEVALKEVKNKDFSFLRNVAKKLDWKNIIYQDFKVMEAIVEGNIKDIREFDLKLN
jgi:glycosyltransferase involved in cell wall biosynthesis